MKKKKVLNKNKLFIRAIFLLVGIILIGVSLFGFLLSPVSNNKDNKVIIIESGDSYSSIASFLEEEKLIRSSFIYKVYINLFPPTETLKLGSHNLNQNMNVSEVIEELGKSPSTAEVTITFKEGLNIRNIATIIEEKTDHTSDEFIALVNDDEYLSGLIEKYWFLTDEILNEEIYYGLEGYLYPNTYNFNVDAPLTVIVETMLNEMDKQLIPYKVELEKSEYTIHEIMTIASMSELEAISEEDREMVARVFYNRLDNNISLGSDVTTYYAAGIDVGERDLYVSELNEANAYNTRNVNMAGILPVGPIANPSIMSIKTAINPEAADYLFFVADKNRDVYFTTTLDEHNQIIADLKAQGLWFIF